MAIWSEPSAPTWLQNLLPDGFFGHISGVDLSGNNVNGKQVLECLSALPEVEGLGLSNCREITDDDLGRIAALNQLHSLSLDGT